MLYSQAGAWERVTGCALPKGIEAYLSSFCAIDAPPVVGTSYSYPIEK